MASKNSESAASDPVHAARRKNLDLALQQIAKDYGEGAIMRLGDDKVAPVEVIPTGNILIDRALGVGGFPRGRIIEVFGPESSGKTTLTLTVIAQAQRRGGLAGKRGATRRCITRDDRCDHDLFAHGARLEFLVGVDGRESRLPDPGNCAVDRARR